MERYAAAAEVSVREAVERAAAAAASRAEELASAAERRAAAAAGAAVAACEARLREEVSRQASGVTEQVRSSAVQVGKRACR